MFNKRPLLQEKFKWRWCYAAKPPACRLPIKNRFKKCIVLNAAVASQGPRLENNEIWAAGDQAQCHGGLMIQKVVKLVRKHSGKPQVENAVHALRTISTWGMSAMRDEKLEHCISTHAQKISFSLALTPTP